MKRLGPLFRYTRYPKRITYMDNLGTVFLGDTNDTVDIDVRLYYPNISSTNNRSTYNYRKIKQLSAYLAFTLCSIKPFLLSYVFLYYIPSPALVSPLALQTLIIVSGIAAGLYCKKSKWGSILWMCSATLDLVISLLIAFMIAPYASKLVAEPDGTINIYMSWIPLMFNLYIYSGILSFVCSLSGVICSFKILVSSTTRVDRFDLQDREEDEDENNENDENEEINKTKLKMFWGLSVFLIFGSVCVLGMACMDVFNAFAKSPPKIHRPGAKQHSDPSLCDPLCSWHCTLPFPSSFWTKEDKSTTTGISIDLKGSVPATRWSSSSKLSNVLTEKSFKSHDGFSTVAPVLFGFDNEILISSLVQASNISLSLDKNQTNTYLINSKTGELVAHFVEVDYYDPSFGLNQKEDTQDQKRLLVLQPAKQLHFNTTYVVAVTHGLKYKKDGSYVAIPTNGSFAALRDDKVNDSMYNKKRANHMHKNVWPILRKNHIERSKLLLAFSFHTISRTSSLSKFEKIRDAALLLFEQKKQMKPDNQELFSDSVFDYKITSIINAKCTESNPTTTIGRTLHGHFLSPNYLIHPGPSSTSGFISPDELDTYHRNGVSQVNFLVRIPCSLLNGSRTTSTLLQYGHGLFGSRGEAEGEYLGKVANNYGIIIVATDWKGMSRYDVPMALRIFTKRIEEFESLPSRTQQGWIDNQLLLKMFQNKQFGLLNNQHLKTEDDATYLLNNRTKMSYYGNSQGSVIGGGYFASSLELTHAVLGVPGAPFSLLLSRSKDFSPYHIAMKLQLWDAIDLRIYLSLMQQLWDSAESGGWLLNIQPSPAKDSKYPSKFALLQAALGDAQVTTVAAEFMARSLNASTIQPQTRYVYGLRERKAPWKVEGRGNALVEWKYDDAPPVRRDRDLPPVSHDTHECPRREARAQEQLYYFLVDHEIVQTCDGICESKKCPDGRSDN